MLYKFHIYNQIKCIFYKFVNFGSNLYILALNIIFLSTMIAFIKYINYICNLKI